MARSDKDIKRLFKRIKAGPEGQDFIDYLKSEQERSYKAFLKCSREDNDLVKGFGLAIDNFLTLFEQCEETAPIKPPIDWA